jgi:predicted O-methyltransferase YrrM
VNVDGFKERLEGEIPQRQMERPTLLHALPLVRRLFDPVADVPGMASPKKQRLLGIAFGCLPEDECYLEVGTFQGKSLVSAAHGNPRRAMYACDNFSEFSDLNSPEQLRANLARHGLDDTVTFFDADFRDVLDREHVADPVGLYFYDGAHDEQSQYDGIVRAEPLLADEALVLVDDWRYAEDSHSYAKAGTERAIADSRHDWRVLYELPARRNGDLAMWWNGLGVLSFRRRAG